MKNIIVNYEYFSEAKEHVALENGEASKTLCGIKNLSLTWALLSESEALDDKARELSDAEILARPQVCAKYKAKLKQQKGLLVGDKISWFYDVNTYDRAGFGKAWSQLRHAEVVSLTPTIAVLSNGAKINRYSRTQMKIFQLDLNVYHNKSSVSPNIYVKTSEELIKVFRK
jgi:hypothetical protein